MNILIFAGGGIGDILMTTPVFRAIKANKPDYNIFVVVMGMTQATVLRNNQNIYNVINLTDSKWKGIDGFFKLVLYCRQQNFQYAFFNHIADRRIFFLIALFGKIKFKVGLDKSSNTRGKGYSIFVKILTHPHKYEFDSRLRTELNLELLQELNIYDRNFSYELPMQKPLSRKSKITVGFHPGSKLKGELKRWDIQNFNLLAKVIKEKFGYEIKFFIGPEDFDLIDKVNDKSELVCNTKFEDVLYMIAECNYFISNDSGLAHVAAAFKIPTIVIYGPTSKTEYILPTKFIAVDAGQLECRPCFHLRKPCRFNKLCLEKVSVNIVFAAFQNMVEN